MLDIEKPRTAIREAGLSAWLLINLFHRDEIADLLLDVPTNRTNTRPWVCLLFPDRPPLKIVHRIEASILDHVPGQTVQYSTREEYTTALARALAQGPPSGGSVAADFSSTIPVGSFLDHGTALLVESCGCKLVPAEDLVARCLGTLDGEGLRSHAEAAKVLHSAVRDAWGLVQQRLGGGGGQALHEGELRDLILSRFSAAGLVTDGPPIVGAGINSNNPHYKVQGSGAQVSRRRRPPARHVGKEGFPRRGVCGHLLDRRCRARTLPCAAAGFRCSGAGQRGGRIHAGSRSIAGEGGARRGG